MTKTPAATGTPGVTREFVGMDSPTARRAGAGGLDRRGRRAGGTEVVHSLPRMPRADWLGSNT